MRKTFIALVLLFAGLMAQAKDMSLRDIRGVLLGKQVVILSTLLDDGSLMEWKRVEGSPETGFKTLYGSQHGVPKSVRGTRGEVIYVDTDSLQARNKDAFGKPIDDSQILNPQLLVVVRTGDGAMIGTSANFNGLFRYALQLADRVDARRNEINAQLMALTGKTFYKTAYTELLNPVLSREDLVEPAKRLRVRDLDTKNLTPLKVIEAKFLSEENAAVLRVELPDGTTRFLFGNLQSFDETYSYQRTLLERMEIAVGEKMPKFTARELAAIKAGDIFRGMSELALLWSWGTPKDVNNLGKLGKQYVYPGNQFVYIQGKAVSDWQLIK